MDNLFKSFKRRSSISSLSNINKFRDLVKTFAKFAIETSNQINEKQQINQNQYPNQIPNQNQNQSHRNSIILQNKTLDINLLKNKLCDFIKNNFKEKGLKSEPKIFFLLISQDYYRIINGILNTYSLNETFNNKDIIIGFLKQFYDFENELYISDGDVIEKVVKDQANDSYLKSLIISLKYMKICDTSEYILDKENEISDIGVKTVLILDIFSKILKQENLQNNSRKIIMENYNSMKIK
jgi:hypothetical protein